MMPRNLVVLSNSDPSKSYTVEERTDTVHGGVYCMMIETLASTGAALWAIENGMGGAMGLSNKTDFLRATTEGVLRGKATPIHRGRNQQLWQVDVIRESDGKLVAQGQVRLQNVNTTEF